MSTLLYIFALAKYQPKYRLKHFRRTEAINPHKNTYLYLINRHAPAPIISEASKNTSAPVGKTRHKSTPAPKASAEAPTVFAKLQRIIITAFHFQYIHKAQDLLIYSYKKRKGAIKIAITTNEILIPKKLTVPKAEKELEFDLSLPEYSPDIARIIKVDCTPFAEKCECTDGRITISGRAVYDLLYETDYKNRLRCVSFTQDFSQSIPLPRNDLSKTQAFCRLSCERIGCKPLSPRRLIFKSTLCFFCEAEGEFKAQAIAVNEDGGAFFRKKTIGFDGKTSVCECVSSFSEPLSLSQSEKCFGEIVCGSISLQSPQITLSQSNAEIKTSASIHVLCEEENNEGVYFVSEKTMPISLTLSQESLSDFKHASADLEVFDARFSPELDQYGESRVIKADFSVRARLKINEPKAYTVADDMFEKEFDSVKTLKTVSLPQILSQSEASFSTEAKLPPAVPKIEAILDSSVRELGTAASIRENGVEISGSFIVTLLAKTEEGVQSFDHTVDYVQAISTESLTPDCEISAECLPVEVLTTLHSDGSATARVIATARVSIYSEKEESFISEITKRVPIAKSDDGNSLIYCYVQRDEDLWSIAKLYRTDPASLRDANPDSFNEQGKSLQSGKPILIKA